ncbi:hypothetical protein BN7_367 [Wickerhamomyces ciferrii]|uniref:Uncharacterized protein n=1 Tax=Wickerhamomyces ciferrii (strain ATCC 14091 / BCRC 22168 / CBS 111 / JCM 3599 / NBRC 0793 / NRRL Y-1031 F-60-10) TaxID=1206466 RepID=K0KI66_WICCF|nr:uncharacterized protein BN7_367 [Wickerhamomyces ciferrii]CCH40833.1 hypothetical protein BN7_367 [Wickerhamomyces ciferrii]
MPRTIRERYSAPAPSTKEISHYEIAPMIYHLRSWCSSKMARTGYKLMVHPSWLKQFKSSIYFVDSPSPLSDTSGNKKLGTGEDPLLFKRYSRKRAKLNLFSITTPTNDQIARGEEVFPSSDAYYFRVDNDQVNLETSIMKLLEDISKSEKSNNVKSLGDYNFVSDRSQPYFPDGYDSFIKTQVCFLMHASKCCPKRILEIMLNIIRFGGTLDELDVRFVEFRNQTHSVSVLCGTECDDDRASLVLGEYFKSWRQDVSINVTRHEPEDVFFIPGKTTYHLEEKEVHPPPPAYD